MKLFEFKNTAVKFWNQYFKKYSEAISSGKLNLEGEGKLLFPNIALFVETEDHFICELIGASSTFKSLREKTHHEKSILKYLFQFDLAQNDPFLLFNGEGTIFKRIIFSRDVDVEKVKKRFPFVENLESRFISSDKNAQGSVIGFGQNFISCHFDDCILINNFNNVFRVKHIWYLDIIRKSVDKGKYLKTLNENASGYSTRTTDDLFAIQYLEKEQINLNLLSGQFANIYLIPGIHETTIGEFIKENPELIIKAFNCLSFEYEPEFVWQEGNPNSNEKSINPDLMIQRQDGFYNILDLKTALLHKKKITTGEHKRRKFIEYVQDGIAQLANYEEYFKFSKNADFAKHKYNIQVENPDLFLVVGNYENVTEEEMREASRMLKSNYIIIDYDTINSLYFSSKTTSS